MSLSSSPQPPNTSHQSKRATLPFFFFFYFLSLQEVQQSHNIAPTQLTASLSVTWPPKQNNRCKTTEIHLVKISWGFSCTLRVTSSSHLFLPFPLSISTMTFFIYCHPPPFLPSLSLAPSAHVRFWKKKPHGHLSFLSSHHWGLLVIVSPQLAFCRHPHLPLPSGETDRGIPPSNSAQFRAQPASHWHCSVVCLTKQMETCYDILGMSKPF